MHQILNKKMSYLHLSLGIIMFISVIVNLLIVTSPALADCTGDTSTNNNQNECIQRTCNEAGQFGAPSNCSQVIKDCENWSASGWSDIGASTLGSNTYENCANAYKSCYQSQAGAAQNSCQNDGVLAVMTMCNNGLVDGNSNGSADGDYNAINGACGSNHAIDYINRTHGSNLKSNSGVKGDREAALKKQCQNIADFARETKCESDVQNAINQCYDQNDGLGKAFSDASFNSCVASKATQDVCSTLSGATWDGQKCKPSAVTQQQQQTPAEKASAQCDIQYPLSTNKNDKDYAKANALNAACKAGANGKNCTEQTSSSGVSVEDLQAACKEGAANTAGIISGKDQLPKPDGQCEFKGADSKTVIVKTNILSCNTSDSAAAAIGEVLKIGVYVLTAAVGVLSVGGLAWASVRYAQARDNQGDVSEAKAMIRNIIIGIIAYGFMMAIINFLLPGGLFK